jgi:hypothetical protein
MSPPTDCLSTTAVQRGLKRFGWVKLSIPTFLDKPEHLIEIARRIGNVAAGRKGRRIEKRTPTSSEYAHANSLSARYGHGAFPLHTDCAHIPIPARYVMLACIRPGSSPTATTLVRFDDLRLRKDSLDLLERGIFLIKNGRRSFYSSICRDSTDFVRSIGSRAAVVVMGEREASMRAARRFLFFSECSSLWLREE